MTAMADPINGTVLVEVDDKYMNARLTITPPRNGGRAVTEEQVRQEFGRYGCGTALSIGKVYAEDGIDDVDKLMQQGDARMYEKKRENHRLTV